MNKNFIATLLTSATIMFATQSIADESVNAKVRDHYVTTYDRKEIVKLQCDFVDVPVYGTRERAGNAAGGALLGMIIGGVGGKAITGNDRGAAAGAIMGGIIGADQGSKPKSETVITGYRQEKQCFNKTVYIDEPKKVYSHSTLVFTIAGKQYKVDFVR